MSVFSNQLTIPNTLPALFLYIASGVMLGGCASTATSPIDTNTAIGTVNNVGMAVFQTAVDQRCRSELTNNNYWRLASVAMTPETQTQLQNNVCGCVSQKAMQNVNIVDITTAAIDPAARSRIVTTAVANTLQSCLVEFIK